MWNKADVTFVPSCSQMRLQLLHFPAVFKTWPTFQELTSIVSFRRRRWSSERNLSENRNIQGNQLKVKICLAENTRITKNYVSCLLNRRCRCRLRLLKVSISLLLRGAWLKPWYYFYISSLTHLSAQKTSVACNTIFIIMEWNEMKTKTPVVTKIAVQRLLRQNLFHVRLINLYVER